MSRYRADGPTLRTKGIQGWGGVHLLAAKTCLLSQRPDQKTSFLFFFGTVGLVALPYVELGKSGLLILNAMPAGGWD